MKRTILVLCAMMLLSACGPSTEEYPIEVHSRIVTYNCKRIDEEKRTAYDCVDTNFQSTKEYHLASTDSWVVR